MFEQTYTAQREAESRARREAELRARQMPAPIQLSAPPPVPIQTPVPKPPFSDIEFSEQYDKKLKRRLVRDLRRYCEGIEANKCADNTINYKSGFIFFRYTRAKHREANYKLAQRLIAYITMEDPQATFDAAACEALRKTKSKTLKQIVETLPWSLLGLRAGALPAPR